MRSGLVLGELEGLDHALHAGDMAGDVDCLLSLLASHQTNQEHLAVLGDTLTLVLSKFLVPNMSAFTLEVIQESLLRVVKLAGWPMRNSL